MIGRLQLLTTTLLLTTTPHNKSQCFAKAFTTHTSFSSLLDKYDAFILDQFGVMHNGKNALPGAIECIERLARTHHKKLIILSNTSSPAKTTLGRLPQLGFHPGDFEGGAITSGEEASRYIRETFGSDSSSNVKHKFIWFTWDPSNENVPNPLDFLEKCGPNVEPTLHIEEADFIIAHGSGVIRGPSTEKAEIISMGNFLNDDTDMEAIDNVLQTCASRNIPLVCANPDLIVKYHDGAIKNMPGKIAHRYMDKYGMREHTNIFGKPHTQHFEACIRELHKLNDNKEERQSKPLRIAHVGDSLHHDIVGANNVVPAIDSIFVLGGIHSDDELLQIHDEDGGMPSDQKLQEFFEKEGGITPTHVIPMFRF